MPRQSVHIGLVNNMPDAAFEATDSQFLALLHAASGSVEIRLSRFMMPDVPRQAAARRFLNRGYISVDELWASQIDGLIVTGREPLTANLEDEPYWKSFTRLVDWAQTNTRAAIWSCLAAHAAVLHLDGIKRERRNAKLCGVYHCLQTSDHPLLAQVPAKLEVPHSRWNSLPASELNHEGYTVLTRTENNEVDAFVRSASSLFLFFQGHPEYSPSSLLREYRRDIKLYLKGHLAEYPAPPENYFSGETEDQLRQMQQHYVSKSVEDFPAPLARALDALERNGRWQPDWRMGAVTLYKNWLGFLTERHESKRIAS